MYVSKISLLVNFRSESSDYRPSPIDMQRRLLTMSCKGVLRGPSRPFPDKPYYDLAKVFFAALRGPSRPFAALRGQKGVSPRPFPDIPNYDLAKVFFAALRGQKVLPPVPSRTYQTMTLQRCSSRPFADKKVLPPVPSRTNHILTSHSIPGLHQLPMRLEIGIGGPPVLSWLEPTIRTA